MTYGPPDGKVKTTVHLPDEMKLALQSLAARSGVGEAELAPKRSGG